MTVPSWLPRGPALLPVLAFALLLSLNVCVLGVFTLPRVLADRKAQARVVTLRSERDAQQQLTDDARRSAETVRTNEMDTARFYADSVPGADGVTVLWNELETMARDTGVRALRRSYRRAEVKGAKLVELAITMPVAGTYNQVADYLKRIEASPHFLVVDRLQLRERQGEPGGGAADLDILLKAYLRSSATPEAKAGR